MLSLRFLIPTLVIVALIGLLAFGLTRDPHAIPSALIGRQAPAFELPRLTQPESLLTAQQLKGEVSVVNVWASWCVSCRAEHELVRELRRRTGVAVYGIDYKDQRPQALRWLRNYGNPFVASGFDADGRVGIDWGVAAVPETYFLDHDGVIRYKQVGPITRQVMQDKLIPLVRRLQREAAS